MDLNISASPALAYVESAVMPDTTQVVAALDRSIHDLVHEGNVKLSTLAKRMDIPEGTLNHKANPNNDRHFFRPGQLLELQMAAGSVAPLRVMANALRYDLFAIGHSRFHGDPLACVLDAVTACAAFQEQAGDALRRVADGGLSSNDMRRMERFADDAHVAIAHALEALRSKVRTGPLGGRYDQH